MTPQCRRRRVLAVRPDRSGKRFGHVPFALHRHRMKQRLSVALATWALASAPMPGHAKVADCPPIVSGGIQYSSHANEVQAVMLATGKVLWRTALFNETYIGARDPAEEEDVQWNIACVREVRARDVLATDRRKRVFRLDRFSGKRIGTLSRNAD